MVSMPLTFRKSSYSNPNYECVEVATNITTVTAVRDSKCPAAATLRFAPASWRAFRDALARPGSEDPQLP